MAMVLLTRSEVRRLLALRDVQAVEALVAANVLRVEGYTRSYLPLFRAEDVRRIAEEAVAKGLRIP